MLSKAAFNAFLKMLEEPPATVLFLLATTDLHKIPETVLSRCFQLFFSPLAPEILIKHLMFVCEQETISYDRAGLMRIARESGGAVRDALTLLERVRLCSPSVTGEAVGLLLGYNDADHIKLIHAIAKADTSALMNCLDQIRAGGGKPQQVWRGYVELLREALLTKQGIASSRAEDVQELVAVCSLEKIINLLDICYEYEPLFAKTAIPSIMLELMLMRHMQVVTTLATVSVARNLPMSNQTKKQETGAPAPVISVAEKVVEKREVITTEFPQWRLFLDKIQQLDDPLLLSIFRQGAFHQEDTNIKLKFGKNLTFFSDWLDNTKKLWEPLVIELFPGCTLLFAFDQVPVAVAEKSFDTEKKMAPIMTPQPRQAAGEYKRTYRSPEPLKEVAVSITDKDKWRTAHTLLRVFPGTVTLVPEEHL
jgi:DNA polymerase-3 subunit gamma/tau